MTTRLLLFLFLAAVCVPGGWVRAGESGTEPILRIETGMHTSMIWALDADAGNRLAATAESIGTVRLWDLRTGRLLRTLLPPRGEALCAVALSPDGQHVACGGWTYDGSIYIYGSSDGRLEKRIMGLPETTAHLAFSHDGTLLAATVYGHGVRIYRTADYRLVFESEEEGGTSFGVDFDPKDRLVTCGKVVRLYDASFHLKATWKNPSAGATPYAVRFSPDGLEIAVALSGSDHVQVLSGTTLAAVRSLPFPTASVCTVGWTPDSTSLVAGSAHLIRRWSRDGKPSDSEIQGEVMCLQPLADGSVAYATSSPSWGRIAAADGSTNFNVPAQTANFTAHVPVLALSADASVVQFAYTIGEPEVFHFDLGAQQIRAYASQAAAPALGPPTTKAPGLDITDCENGAARPVLNGKPLPGPGSTRGLAIAPDGKTFAVSGAWAVACFDANATMVWKLPVANANRINFSADGEVFVVAYTDGTIHWYRVRDQRELLAFFPHADRQRWVAWTPEGYYDCSPGAENLIGWQVHHGKEQAPGYYPAAQFRNVYYRPDVVGRVLKTLDVPGALREADRARGLVETDPAKINEVITRLSPPTVALESGGIFGTLTVPAKSTKMHVRYRLQSVGEEPPASVTARFNGRLLDAALPLPKAGETAEADVPIPANEPGELALFASHRLAVSTAAILRIERDSAATTRRPNLYVVAVGVAHQKINAPGSDFQPPEGGLTLDDIPLADRDARVAAEALGAQKGRFYGSVRSQVLTNERATGAALREALGQVAAAALPGDVAVVFFSGHGVSDSRKGYYLATYEADPNALETTALAGSELSTLLERIRARTVLALDTCHSGGALAGGRLQQVITGPNDLGGLINALASAEQGTVVLSSSAASEQSLGDPRKGGIFTLAFCEALNRRAAAGDGGVLTCRAMQAWLDDRVPKLAAALVKGAPNAPRQTPCLVIPEGVPDFPLAKPFEGFDPPARFRTRVLKDNARWTWTRRVEHWELIFPSGRVRQFDGVGRDTVEGRPGSVLQAKDDRELRIFVSDKSSTDPRVYLRKGAAPWDNLGAMEEVR